MILPLSLHFRSRRRRRATAAAAEDAAADWLVRRRAGLSGGEEAEFRRWLSTDPLHEEAYACVEDAWMALVFPRDAGCVDAALAKLKERGRRRARRRVMALGGAAAAVAAASWALVLSPSRPSPRTAPPPPEPTTVAVYPEIRRLPDGTVAELNARTEIAWDFSGGVRRVRLLSGEAMFTVAHDPAHPFIVDVDGLRVRDVGTVFNVKLDDGAVDVLVTRGKVQVEGPPAGAAAGPGRDLAAALRHPVSLVAGEQATISLDPRASHAVVIARVYPPDMDRMLAWHMKRIEFTGTPLHEAVDWFNRENRIKLAIGDDSIRNLEITGVFWADDPEGFIRLLKSALDLRVEEKRSDLIVLGAP